MSDVTVPFQRFLDGQREAVWRFLVAAVGPDEADDCFQETFIAALRAYPRLRPGSNARAWVLTIAHNKALDCHRRRARAALPLGDAHDLEARDRTAATAAPAGRYTPADGLWQAVNGLPERQRSAVVLRFFADLPHGEIASALGCSEEAARRSLHEALSKLRKVVAA